MENENEKDLKQERGGGAVPPPYEGEPPMYGSTATGSTDAPAAPAVDSTFLAHVRRGFWDS